MIDVCPHLTHLRVNGSRTVDCLYWPDYCSKEPELICPVLGKEVERGEILRKKLWIDTVRKMDKDYFCCYLLSLPQKELDRTEAIQIYAEMHGLKLLGQREHETMAAYIQRCLG